MALENDSIILRNQPIAREGVLQYGSIKKLKKWSDLKRNIGRRVHIVDEHPPDNNGNRGFVAKSTKRYGFADIKQCPTGNKKLCADLVMDDGSPIKGGYSIGFGFKKVEEKGKLGEEDYDQVQSNLWIDHIALTNYPRDQEALQVSWDSEVRIVDGNMQFGNGEPEGGMDESDKDSDAIIINSIGYDSHRFSLDSEYGLISEKLKNENPNMDETELTKRALLMLANKQKIKNRAETNMPEDKEKNGKDSDNGKSREDLVSELARLRAERDSRKETEEEIQKLKSELKSEKDSKDNFKKLYEGEISKTVNRNVDSLVKVHGFDKKDFDEKSSEFIEGALFAASKISTGPDKTYPVTEGDSKDGDGESEILPGINDYRYDHDSGKMVLTEEFKALKKEKEAKK